MADEASGIAATATEAATWQGRWVSAVALAAAIILVALLGLVTLSDRTRESAVGQERNIHEVILLVRTLDASLARAEAAMGRYVIDETRDSATYYYQEWRRAARQIEQLRTRVQSDPGQARRVEELRQLFEARGGELSRAAAASSRREGIRGVSLFYSAAKSQTLPRLHAQLDALEQAGRQALAGRVRQREEADARSDQLMQWLGWVAVLISALAIALSYWAYRAFAEGRIARTEADNEYVRASELQRAVEERTGELSLAYERLQAESAERLAAEEKLRQIQKMEAVGALTGGIAHDFNNMLAVVVGGLDLARRKLHRSPGEVDTHLESAMEGATRAAALTRRLLAFARAEPLLPEAVAPAELVQGMLELIDRTIGERVKVHTSAPDELWQVWADRTGLENAVLNLCVNARDAMAETGDLTIGVDNIALAPGEVGALDAGEFVRIRVADTGSGISPEHLERVFEPFFTTKPVGKGTGLGLSQIFGFARQSGGDVAIQSEVGKGTTVSIYLPRALDVSARIAASEQRASDVPGRGGPAGPSRILVVEDDPRVSRSTVTALQELGHDTVAVASAKAALEVLANDSRFDLIITDIVMPEMTGVELAREVARHHGGLRILFVTGYVGEAGTFEELGGADLLRKPFTVAQLSVAVDRALPRDSALEAAAE